MALTHRPKVAQAFEVVVTSTEIKVERIIKAIEWIALHRTGDNDQQHDLLAILHGPRAKESSSND